MSCSVFVFNSVIPHNTHVHAHNTHAHTHTAGGSSHTLCTLEKPQLARMATCVLVCCFYEHTRSLGRLRGLCREGFAVCCHKSSFRSQQVSHSCRELRLSQAGEFPPGSSLSGHHSTGVDCGVPQADPDGHPASHTTSAQVSWPQVQSPRTQRLPMADQSQPVLARVGRAFPGSLLWHTDCQSHPRC